MECQCKQCNCDKCRLKRLVREIVKEEMIVPKDGKDGIDGYTPIKEVDYFDGVDGLNGKGIPEVYHLIASESAIGNKISVGNNIYYSTQRIKDNGLINVRLQGTQNLSGKTITDVHYSTNSIKGSRESLELDNMVYTLTDGIQSMDLHKTTIRSKNARTGLWEMYEVNMLPSMNNTRIDVWVYEIYKDFVGEWK